MATMTSGLGGTAGYGEQSFKTTGGYTGNLDDGSKLIDITSVFGSDGMVIGGTRYTGLYINTNGLLTFNSANPSYTPGALTSLGQPSIAPFWTDIDISKGGDIYWDFDATNGKVTITWLNARAYSAAGTDSFQVVLTNLGGGDFGIEYNYDSIGYSKGYTGEATVGFSDGVTQTLLEGSGDPTFLATYASNDFDTNDPAGVFSMNVEGGRAFYGDGIVDGTTGNDLIDVNYVGDVHGDLIDHNDATGYSGTNGQDDYVLAGAGNDTVLSGLGNDIVYGGDGNDSVNAGNGNDTVYGDAGNDTLDGASGNDVLYGGAGDDVLSGGAAAAAITYTPSYTKITTGVQSVTGTNGRPNFTINTVSGDNDLTTGTSGGITGFRLGNGDSTETHTHTASSQLSGGQILFNQINANETLTITIDGVAVNLNAAISAGTVTFNGASTYSINGSGQVVRIGSGASSNTIGTLTINVPFTKIALASTGTTTGTAAGLYYEFYPNTNPLNVAAEAGGNDSLFGGDGNDVLYGGDGNDTLFGGNNNDQLYGGTGNDSLAGDAGNDLLYGGDGNDSLDGGTESDTLYGDLGDDTLSGGSGDDTLYGGDGNDQLYGGTGNDSLSGDAGNDLIYGGDGNDTIDGGDGNDTLYGDAGNDSIMGGLGNDSLFGGDGNDLIYGGDGNDTIDGGADNDTLYGDAGNDSINGGAGDDSIYGGLNDDSLFGGDGNDLLDGGDGNDSLHGDAGNDVLSGGLGSDTIFGDAGNDTIFGGDGADHMYGGDDEDTFVIQNNPDGSTVDGGEGGSDHDTLDLTNWGWVKTDIFYDPMNHENGTVLFYDNLGNTVGSMAFQNIEKLIVCLTPGVMVATELGEVAVEKLQVGDLVLTRDNGLQPIRWIGSRELTIADLIAQPALQPVRILAGALGYGTPCRDLLVSPQHRMLMQGAAPELLFGESEVLVAAQHLTALDGIDQVLTNGVTYIHVMLDQHEILLADGAWTESLQPAHRTVSMMDVHQRAEIEAIFPDLEENDHFIPAARLSLKSHEARVLVNRLDRELGRSAVKLELRFAA